MTSWMILSCASESVLKPMRLAGTCRRYSNSAMPQLTIAATYHGRSARLRRCAYHAMVMNRFEAIRSRRVGITDIRWILRILQVGECERCDGRVRRYVLRRLERYM